MKILLPRYNKPPRKSQNTSRLYMRLKSRITLYFFLLVIVPAILTVTAIYYHTRSLMEEMSYSSAVSRISQEKGYISKCMEELELSVYTSASSLDPADARYLSGSSTSRSADILSAMISKNFTPIQQKALSAVYVIDGDTIKASFGPDSALAAISSPSSQKWFMDASSNTGEVVILGTVQRFYSEGVNKIVLSFAKSAGDISKTGSGAVLLYDFNYSLISDLLSVKNDSEPSDSPSHMDTIRMILDNDGNIIYCHDSRKLTSKAEDVILSKIRNADEDFIKVNYNGNDYFMTFVKYEDSGWTFIDLEPVSNVTDRLWLRSPLLTVILAAFALMLLIYLGIIFGLLKPINDLTSVIADYGNQFSDTEGHMPLLQVQKNYFAANNTSDVDYLINKISSIKLSQKEAELNSLQNQINPHFLYNTLESIRGAALYHGIHEIASMSKSLSLLFRYSISDRVLVSVKEELQHLENYISIQNFRFEDKFELQCNIPPELMTYKILKLTLQPLIENSIKHGLEMKLGKGTIKIEILSLDSNIKIIISDDGLGIPLKKLEELNRALANDKNISIDETARTGTGIGVMNVNSRIKLYFGEQYGLKFREALAGTTVEITLPAVKES